MISQADGKIIIELDLEDDEFNRNLNQAESKTKNFGGTIKNLLATFGLLKAGTAVFGLLRDSVGSAMNRLDTMDQYNRVMTAMTGSNEMATKSLEEVKNAVTGTAYGLDVAASSTQKFVTSGMEISKSTEQVKIWGDAVAFYGKGTNESYANVTDALSKMIAKGKVEMDQLNRLTDEGIPAVQIFADYTGRSMVDVQDSLSDGSISANEFVSTMQEAMQNGTAKFKGIKGAAKEAGASWTGTIDNMKAAVTRGMTDLITNVDKGMEKAGLGSLKNNISSFGKTAEKVLGDVGGKIPGVIKLLSDLKGPIIALGIATTGMKLVKPISDTYGNLKVLKGGLSEVFSLTKGDMSLPSFASHLKSAGEAAGESGKMLTSMGGIVASLPMASAAVGLGALVAGFVALKDHVDNSPMGKLHKEISEATKAINEMQEATDKQVESSLSEQNYYSSIRDELMNLVDANGKVKEGYEDRASFITGQLNTAYGAEMTMIDGVIQGYQEQMSNLEQLMEKQRAQSILDAYSDDYDEAIKKQEKYNETYGKLQKAKIKQDKCYNEEYKKLIAEGLSGRTAIQETWARVFQKGLKIDDSDYNEARKNMITTNTLTDKIEKARTAMAQGNYAEVENILSAHSYNIDNINKQSNKKLKDTIADAQALYEAHLTMSEEYASKGDMANAEKYQNKANQYAADIEQMRNSLDTQNGVLNEKSEAYKTAMANYQDAGLQGAWGKIQNFNEVGKMLINALADGVTSASIEGVGSVQRVGENMIATINGMDYIFNSSGQLLGSSITFGIDSGFEANKDTLYNKTGTLSKEAIENYAKGDWKGTGSKAVFEIAEGTKINGKKIKEKMQIAKDGTIKVWDDKEGKYAKAGKAVCDGINLGIDVGNGVVITAFGNVAKGGLKEFKRVLGINSPSIVMEQMGSYIPQGVGIGINENAEVATKSISEMAKDMIGSAKQQIDKASLEMQISPLDNPLMNMKQTVEQRVNLSTQSLQKQVVEYRIDLSAMPEMIDYDRLAESCAKINFNLELDRRTFGRVVKEVK